MQEAISVPYGIWGAASVREMFLGVLASYVVH